MGIYAIYIRRWSKTEKEGGRALWSWIKVHSSLFIIRAE